MFDWLRGRLLRFLRVPDMPSAPMGSVDSVKIFRAGANLYKWCLIRWGLTEFVATLILVVAFTLPVSVPAYQRWPEWLRVGWQIMEAVVAVGFLSQLALTYAMQRLDFEMRWYVVTDRSLRIRSGIWSVEELTMTFANIQQVNLTQGPLQRFLGIADLDVTSAGGGGGKQKGKPGGQDAHTGCFEGVENAEAIRDLILERLRHYRDAGLGDHGEPRTQSADALEAAKEVLAEARELRRSFSLQ